MKRVEIGVVSRPHGVRGELRVHLYNSDSTALDVVSSVYVDGDCFEIELARIVKGGALLRLQLVNNRTRAEAMVGKVVEVIREELELEPDELLLDDLVGLQLLLEDGSSWGKVAHVIPGVQDLLVVHQDTIERYLPVVDAFIKTIDLEAGTILVTPPEELPEWER